MKTRKDTGPTIKLQVSFGPNAWNDCVRKAKASGKTLVPNYPEVSQDECDRTHVTQWIVSLIEDEIGGYSNV